MGEAGGLPCSAVAHPLLFPGQRSREEQAAGKGGQQSSLGDDDEFSMEENSLYSSRGKGRHQDVGKVQRSWVCQHRRQHMSPSISSPPFPRHRERFCGREQPPPWLRAGGVVEGLLLK